MPPKPTRLSISLRPCSFFKVEVQKGQNFKSVGHPVQRTPVKSGVEGPLM